MAESQIDIFAGKLLIVDDEPVNLKLLERTLAKAGYREIESTMDPREVCDRFEQNNHDLILLDLNMPHMDGFSVLKALTERFQPMPPVLVLTAQSAQEYRTQALELGAQDYVTKPFERNELLHRVSNLLESRLYRQGLEKLNESLEEKVAERTKQLNETRLQVVRRLGRAGRLP